MSAIKYIGVAVAGAAVTFGVLTIIAQKKDKKMSQVGEKTLKALRTKEGLAMVLTPEGRAFASTVEFKDLLKTLTREKATQLLGVIG